MSKKMNIKLLAVEDTAIARKMIQITLSSLGYSVDMAVDGTEAIRLFKENNYDLVFMDLGLPDIHGIEVSKELQKIESKQSIPIVALTAHHTEEDKELGLAAGMKEFILKPLTKEAAESVINKYVKK